MKNILFYAILYDQKLLISCLSTVQDVQNDMVTWEIKDQLALYWLSRIVNIRRIKQFYTKGLHFRNLSIWIKCRKSTNQVYIIGSSAVGSNMFLESNASWIPRTYLGSSFPGTYFGSSIPGTYIKFLNSRYLH